MRLNDMQHDLCQKTLDFHFLNNSGILLFKLGFQIWKINVICLASAKNLDSALNFADAVTDLPDEPKLVFKPKGITPMKSGPKAEIKRIGILGAAFDPPHFGHFLLAQMALNTGEIDEIWMVPSPERWDKSPVAPGQQRLSWLQMAVRECPAELKSKLTVSDVELQLPTYRGTQWLLSQLRRTHPAASFALILGWDSFVGIPKWRDPTTGILNGDELLRTTRLYVSPRALSPEFATEHPTSHPNGVVMLPSLDEPTAGNIDWMKGIQRNEVAALSSSLVRTALGKGERLRFIFSDVEKEIFESRIYDKS
ncbi:MAG: hypothetical protein RI953_2598 [Pseudomonadota bacterium]|jgi:nicotinate-nucleotide adenylyltransferase